MSPIYVRPAREQHEHDRLIRFLQRQLQAKHKKKLEITINPGDEQSTAVKVGPATLFPDLVLAEGKALAGIVEIETGESVNNLEAMHQWVPFSRTRVPFHLYVPVNGYDTARRLIQANQARVTEIWTYRPANDGFDLVRMHTDPAAVGAGKALKAVIVPVAPKPVLPPPPPEPPPPPKPLPEAKAPKGGKMPVKAMKAPQAAPPPAKAAAPMPGAAPAKSAVLGPAAVKTAPSKVNTPVPAKAPAAKAPVKPAAKPVKVPPKPVKPARVAPKPAPKKAAPRPAAKVNKVKARKPAANGKKKGSTGKKGR